MTLAKLVAYAGSGSLPEGEGFKRGCGLIEKVKVPSPKPPAYAGSGSLPEGEGSRMR